MRRETRVAPAVLVPAAPTDPLRSGFAARLGHHARDNIFDAGGADEIDDGERVAESGDMAMRVNHSRNNRTAAEIHDADEKTAPSVVKVIGTPTPMPRVLRALYFTRATAPTGDGPLYHHIGIYAYRRVALERFVSLPPSHLELREKLEQLRALEDGMRIDVAIVDTIPLGVDTPADLERARRELAAAT